MNFTAPHNAVNLTAAAAAYDALGLPLDGLAAGAEAVAFSRWRGEQLELAEGGLLIADCYNANPTSMRAALEHLAGGGRPPRGGWRCWATWPSWAPAPPPTTRSWASCCASRGSSRWSRSGRCRARYGGRWFATVEQAREQLTDLIRPGDAVLVKASRSMGLEAIVEAIAP